MVVVSTTTSRPFRLHEKNSLDGSTLASTAVLLYIYSKSTQKVADSRDYRLSISSRVSQASLVITRLIFYVNYQFTWTRNFEFPASLAFAWSKDDKSSNSLSSSSKSNSTFHNTNSRSLGAFSTNSTKCSIVVFGPTSRKIKRSI